MKTIIDQQNQPNMAKYTILIKSSESDPVVFFLNFTGNHLPRTNKRIFSVEKSMGSPSMNSRNCKQQTWVIPSANLLMDNPQVWWQWKTPTSLMAKKPASLMGTFHGYDFFGLPVGNWNSSSKHQSCQGSFKVCLLGTPISFAKPKKSSMDEILRSHTSVRTVRLDPTKLPTKLLNLFVHLRPLKQCVVSMSRLISRCCLVP